MRCQRVNADYQEYEALQEEREFEEEYERMKYERQERNARLQQQAVEDMEEKLRNHVSCCLTFSLSISLDNNILLLHHFAIHF